MKNELSESSDDDWNPDEDEEVKTIFDKKVVYFTSNSK